MQNMKNNAVGFFGIAVSSWCNTARGPSYALNLGATRMSLSRYFLSWASNRSPGKVGEHLCTQSCTKLDANLMYRRSN